MARPAGVFFTKGTRVAQLRCLCTDLRQRLSASQSTQAHLAEALVQDVA